MIRILAVASNSNAIDGLLSKLIRKRLESPRIEVFQPPRANDYPGVSRARRALEEAGPMGFNQWLASSTRLLIGDTTLERLQSTDLVPRINTVDLCSIASEAVRLAPELAVLEIASGQSFGQALAKSRECPFRRIEEIRRAAPGHVFRATLSAAANLGPSLAPRSALPVAVDELVDAGIDVIRITDPYNDIKRLSTAVAAASVSEAFVEGVVNVTSSLHPMSAHPFIDKAITITRELERNGAHSIVIEDQAGLMRPVGAYTFIRNVRRETELPLWVRVAETSGFGIATLIAAVEAGAVGVDTTLPSIARIGLEPSSLAILCALSDTERQPELDVHALEFLDETVSTLVRRLDGRDHVVKLPVDAGEQGVTVEVLDAVQKGAGGPSTISADHALSACAAAVKALGTPAMTSPALRAVVILASTMINNGEDAGTIIDRARADDPEGLLDSMGNLREGGFPGGALRIKPPRGRRQLLELLWGVSARRFHEHVDDHGMLEFLPSEAILHGLGVGDHLDLLIDGEPLNIHIVSVDNEQEKATIEKNGEEVVLSLKS